MFFYSFCDHKYHINTGLGVRKVPWARADQFNMHCMPTSDCSLQFVKVAQQFKRDSQTLIDVRSCQTGEQRKSIASTPPVSMPQWPK
jgi:hypothetical protein